MLIETLKTLPTGKTLDVNLEQVAFVGNFYKPAPNEEIVDEKASLVTMSNGVIIPLQISRADLLKKMKNYK